MVRHMCSSISQLQKQDSDLRSSDARLREEDKKWRARVELLLEAKNNDDELIKSLKKEIMRLHNALQRLEDKQHSGFRGAVESWDREALLTENATLRNAADKARDMVELYTKQTAERDQGRLAVDAELTEARKQVRMLSS
jgi:hypothetical protein